MFEYKRVSMIQNAIRFPFQIQMIDNAKVELVFYGDRTRAVLHKEHLMPFDDGCALYSPGTRPLLNKAVKEALFEKWGQKAGKT